MENRADYLLESYFANTLSAPELEELKRLIANDRSVAAEFAFQQKLSTAVQPQKLADSIQNTSWKSVAQSPVAIKTSMWPRFYYAAAAVIILLVAAYVFFQTPDLQTIVADNTALYQNNMKSKSLGEEAQSVPPDVIAAFSHYDHKAYKEAADALEPIVKANPERMDYRFFWGVSLVQSKQYTAAINALTPVTQSQDEKSIPALYYLGLACAGNGDKDCARQNLQAYIDSPSGISFRKQAKVVIQAL